MTIGDVFPLALIFVCIAVPACAAARLTVASGIGEPSEGRVASAWLYGSVILTLIPAALARVDALSRGWVILVGATAFAVGAVLWIFTQPAVATRVRVSLVIVALFGALAAPQLSSIWERPDAVPAGTPWYFTYLAQQYQDEHGVPRSSVEFGVETSALTDYTGFSSATAAINEVVPGPYGMLGEQVMRTIACIGALLGFAALARALGANRLASLAGAGFLSVLAYYSGKVSSYRPEAFGYALMFLVPAFALAYLRDRRRSDLVAAAVGLAAVSQIHGISLAVCAIMVAGVFASRLPAFIKSWKREIVALLTAGLVMGGAWLATDLAMSGRFTQAGKATALPPVQATGEDPSLEFASNVRAFPDRPIATTWRGLLRNSVERGFAGEELQDALFRTTFAGCALVSLLGLILAFRRFLPVAIFGAVAGAAIIAVCVIFEIGWDTFVPRRTGLTRFFSLGFALPIVLGAVAVSMLPRPALRKIATGAFALLAGVSVVASAHWVFEKGTTPPRDQLAELRALDLPDNANVLTNAYSEGFVAAVLHRAGYVDGRGPYHQEALLLRAADRLKRTHQFLADPSSNAVDLEGEGVNYLLIATGDPAFGTFERFSTDLDALKARPDIEVVQEGPGYVLLKVTNGT